MLYPFRFAKGARVLTESQADLARLSVDGLLEEARKKLLTAGYTKYNVKANILAEIAHRLHEAEERAKSYRHIRGSYGQ